MLTPLRCDMSALATRVLGSGLGSRRQLFDEARREIGMVLYVSLVMNLLGVNEICC